MFSQCCGCGCWEFGIPLSHFPSPDLFIWDPVSYVCVKCSCPHSPASTWGLRHRQEITNYFHGPWSDNVYTVKVSGLGLFCIWPISMIGCLILEKIILWFTYLLPVNLSTDLNSSSVAVTSLGRDQKYHVLPGAWAERVMSNTQLIYLTLLPVSRERWYPLSGKRRSSFIKNI